MATGAAVAILAACGSDSDASSPAPGEVAVAAAADDADTAAESATGEQTAAAGGAAAPIAVPLGLADRSIVRTAAVTVAVDDVETASARVADLAAVAGGIVSAADVHADAPATAVVTLRVPPAELQATIGRAAELGRVVERSQDAADVTAQVVDLDARIRSAEASVDRVRGFLDRAANVSELAGLEAELTARETALEQLRAEQRALDDQVDLATLTVTLLDAADHPDATAAADEPDGSGIVDAFRDGAEALAASAHRLAVVIAAALPFLAVVAIVGVPLRWWWTRRAGRPTAGADHGRAGAPLPPPT